MIKAKYWVTSETEHALSVPPIAVSRRIIELERPLPDGLYTLFVDGVLFQARLSCGGWDIQPF